jgi:hypothetical protein
MSAVQWIGVLAATFAVGALADEPKPVAKEAEQSLPVWPVQIEGRLNAGFFKKEKWSWPSWIVEHDDGHLEDTTGGSTKGVKKIRHTAEVTSTCLGEHVVNFADAWLEPDGRLGIYVNELNPAYLDDLLLMVKDGNFSAQFTTVYKRDVYPKGWVATRATLKLDKKKYAIGDVVKGELDVEFREEPSKHIIKLKGYIKPKITAERPHGVTAGGVLLPYAARNAKAEEAPVPKKTKAN